MQQAPADKQKIPELEAKIERMEQVRSSTRRPGLNTEQFHDINPSPKLGARYVNFRDGDGAAGRPCLAAKVSARDATVDRTSPT